MKRIERGILDNCVLIEAAQGNPTAGQIIEQVLKKKIRMVMTPRMMGEFDAALNKPKVKEKLTENGLEAVVCALYTALIIDGSNYRERMKFGGVIDDEGDLKFAAAAQRFGLPLVTNDSDLLNPARELKRRGVHVISMWEFAK